MYPPPTKDRISSTSRGVSAPLVVGVLVAILLLFIAIASWRGFISTGTQTEIADVHEVKRGDFIIKMPATGELSANQLVEIRNPLETQGVITEIVNEGTFVQKGDVLIKFNEDEIEQKIKEIEDKLVEDKNRVVNAEQSLAIAKSTMESNLEKADLAIDIAQLALQAWQEGEHLQMIQKYELALETATINADRLSRRFEEAKDLVENGFISRDEYERDRIAKIESAAGVKQANIDLDVYTRFTSKQDEKQKISDTDQAIAERSRVKQRHDAELVTQSANVESALAKLESTQERLAELREQFGLCTVFAPTDGLVVYRTSMRSDRSWRNDDSPPTIGTALSPNELVILLPDTSQMIANVKVSEALSGRIQPGMPTTTYSDAHPNTPIKGVVQGVSVLAEGGGWRDPNRRDYTVRIVLEVDPSLELKPSMRCRSEIELGTVQDALSVPIQSIFREGPLAYVYVPEDGGWAQKEVSLGRASELSVEVMRGIDVGDLVLLREPDPVEVVSRIPNDRLRSTGQRGGPPPGVGGKPGGPPAGVGGKPSGPPAGVGGKKASGPPPGVSGKPDEVKPKDETADSKESQGAPARKTASAEGASEAS